MKRIFTLLSLFALCAVTKSNAQSTILAFDYSSIGNTAPTTFGSTTNVSGVQSSTTSRGSGLTPNAQSSVFNSSNFTTNTTLSTSDYYEFTITPATGAEIRITSINLLRGTRSPGNSGFNDGGPTRFSLRTGTFTTDAATPYIFANGDATSSQTAISNNFVLTTPIVTTTAVTFRIYGYDSENSDGEFGLGGIAGNDLTVQGFVGPNTETDNFFPSPAPSGNPISGNVVSNDANPFGGNLNATLVRNVESGTLVLNANGTFTYTPQAGFSGGLRTFTYRAFSTANPTATSVETTVNLNYQDNISLPVTFISLDAKKASNGTQVTWKVGTENNVKLYEIERSVNGGAFTRVGFVSATGAAAYSFNDVQPAEGTILYRVKNVDYDGRYKYSSTINFKNGSTSVAFKAFPLPAQNSLTVQHTTTSDHAQINIVSMDGRILRTIALPLSATQTDVNLSGLKSGMYLLLFVSGKGTVETMKIIKQ